MRSKDSERDNNELLSRPYTLASAFSAIMRCGKTTQLARSKQRCSIHAKLHVHIGLLECETETRIRRIISYL